MASPRETSIWNKIRKDLSESQQLILNGRYNDAMILNKNILATIVQLQLDKAVLVSNTLESDVDQLYDSQVISDETHQKYVKIAQYGSQAEAGAMPTAQAANDSFSCSAMHFLPILMTVSRGRHDALQIPAMKRRPRTKQPIPGRQKILLPRAHPPFPRAIPHPIGRRDLPLMQAV